MNRKILYFINPVSGAKRKPLLKDAIEERMLSEEIPFEIALTTPDGEYPGLADKVKKEGITDVVICGGDGTVNQVTSGLLDASVNIGIIPCGSGNGLALAAKIPRNIQRALQIVLTGNPTSIDSFFINEKFSCMLCGVGFDAQVAHDFALQPKRGLMTYVEQSVKNFITAKPYPFDITCGGKTFLPMLIL